MKKAVTLLLLFIAVASFAQTKVVLLEEGTGTWCEYCPRGEVFGHLMRNQYPGQVLIVAVHASDPMAIIGTSYLTSLNFDLFPSAHTDRSSAFHDPEDWPTTVPPRLALDPPADVSVTRVYDANTRVLEITVEAQWYTTMTNADIRIGAVIVEDGVTGPPPSYSQVNIFSGGPVEMGGYELLPNPVPASLMVYDHVARGLLSAFDGVPNSIPANPQAGTAYSHTFSTAIPLDQDPEYVRVYGYLVDMNDGGAIANAGGGPYALGDMNARPFFHSDSSFVVATGSNMNIAVLAHDPDDDVLTITAVSGLPAWATLNMVGTHDAALTGIPPSTGTHTIVLQVSDGDHTRTMNVELEVIPNNNSWVQVGMPGFSGQPPQAECQSAIDPVSGTPYAALTDPGNMLFVYSFDGSAWSALGSPLIGASPIGAELQINPISGEPWVAYGTAGDQVTVMRFSGGSWLPVETPLLGGSDNEIAFSPNGFAFMCTKTPQGGPARAYVYDGFQWEMMGEEITIPGTTEVTDLRMEYNAIMDGPVIIANGVSANGSYSHVLEWDGFEWNSIGGPVDPDAPTIGTSKHQLAITPDGEYFAMIAHTDGTDIYNWNGSAWVTIADNIDGGVGTVFDIESDNVGAIYAVYQNTLDGLTCERRSGSNWTTVGAPDFTPDIGNSADLSIYPTGEPGVVYMDGSLSNQLSMQWYGTVLTGIEPVPEKNIALYPNPTTSNVFVEDAKQGEPYYVFDVLGAQVAQGVVLGRSIPAATLKPGIYTLVLPYSGKKGRFVKE